MVPDPEKIARYSNRKKTVERHSLCNNVKHFLHIKYYPPQYYILHITLSQVPYMRDPYIITSDIYIFFQIFRVTQTSRIWGSVYVQLSQNHQFRIFWWITMLNHHTSTYNLVLVFLYYIFKCPYGCPDTYWRIWVSTLNALFIDFRCRGTIWWITPQKPLITGWKLLYVYIYYYYTLPHVRLSHGWGIGIGI